MTSDNKDKDNIQNENAKLDGTDFRFFLTLKIFDLLPVIFNAIVKITLGYFCYLSIDALAGKTTITNVVLSYLKAKESDFGMPWILAFIFFLWAIFERKERRRKTEQLHKHNRKLEMIINPDRSSSGLLPTGETNPKDERI
ncbi:MAG: hypothetical protein HRU77_04295 [Gammaproteobacteria bacterium]|nr:MAG: hypothetical protein HRU77_04295 [Gammaproteobacteria bacterium]